MHKLITLILVFSVTFANAQIYRIKVIGEESFCGFNIESGYYTSSQTSEYIVRKSEAGDNSGLADVVDAIKSSIQSNFTIDVFISHAEDNCYASILEDGTRIIVGDQWFLNNVNKESGTKWAAISILAHEVGHHIAGFNREKQGELDADYWSGFILHNLGASESASVKCILYFGTEFDSGTHPNKYARSDNIKMGWQDAKNGRIDQSRCQDNTCN